MLKREFEQLALRKNVEISSMLYDSIEAFYMSDSWYHQKHGGIEESKQDFVKRVFGGKVNTPAAIVRKITAEACKENRWCLAGGSATEEELTAMDTRLAEHYQALARMK